MYRSHLVLSSFFSITLSSSDNCRDPYYSPFSSDSIWLTPIGSNAQYMDAGLFRNKSYPPNDFFSDDDYFIVTKDTDPVFPWYNQGWWGTNGNLTHCDVIGHYVNTLHFPANLSVTAFGNNNAAGILQPDNDTLILTQPLYKCNETAPILSIYAQWKGTNNGTLSIRSNGTYGGHGGSGLSAIGGTIRLGELLPNTPPISHALKLELWAHIYYYAQNPCYNWPANTCDGYHNNCPDDPIACYGGTNPYLTPGSLLAIPVNISEQLNNTLTTIPAKKILYALTYYGGYLVDDTYWNRATFCTMHGVTDEFQAYYNYSFNTSPNSPFYNDLLLIFQNLAIVINNSPTSIGGGGTPLQPLAPPLCTYN